MATEKKAAKKKPTRKYEGLLADVGTGVGSIFGKKGSMVGKAAGTLLGNMFGWGDYESTPGVMYPIESNTLFGRQLAQQIPLMHSGDGLTRIAHREFCCDVFMAGTFETGTRHEVISPINGNLFPWLSKIADSYSQYKFLGLSFGFRGLASNTTTTGSLGSVAMATVYDVRSRYFSSKAQMLGNLFSTSCKPTDTMLHPVECDPSKTPSLPRYTRVNLQEAKVLAPYGTGTIARDLGQTHGYENPTDFFGTLTYSAVNESLGTSVVKAGELWVTYDIALFKPVIEIPPSEIVNEDEVLVPVSTPKPARR